DSVDIVWSNCVLEHVSDYDSLMHETWRTLKPGGLAIHIIHLQDHLTFNNGGDWLRFLTYNERKWNAMFSHRTTWCNRLRSSQWHELFEEKPWEIVEFAEQTAPFHPQFERSRLASPFNSMSERDLAVSWVHTTLRKPTDVSLATPYPIAKLDAGGKPVLIKRRFNQPCRSSASGFRSSTARTNLAVHHKVV
ncbi:MAG: class I SAM-dependent methyltransferase, partial [Planctomycetota bacterium]